MRRDDTTMRPSDRDRHVTATVACVLVAIVFRAWHIAHGLPDLTEEAFPFRHALALWRGPGGHLDLNPHWFVYPSLTIYLQFLVQLALFKLGGCRSPADFVLLAGTDPTVAVILGRLVSVIADAVTIVFAGRLVRRHGAWAASTAMLLVAVAPTLIRTSRLIYADSVMCAFAVAGLSLLADYREHGTRRALAIAAALIGAAIGSKYPAIVLVVPLLATILARERGRLAWTRCLGAVAVVALVFVLTTPFLLADWPRFVNDMVYIRDAATGGQLGSLGGSAGSFCASTLAGNLGWIGVALALASPWLVRGDRVGPTRMLGLAWILVFLPIARAPVLAERYLLPAIALGACLAAIGLAAMLERLGTTRSRDIAPLVVALAMAQPAWAGWRAASAGRTTTQLEAKRWCETHLGDDQLMLSEAYGPTLPTVSQRSAVQAEPLFQAASRRVRVGAPADTGRARAGRLSARGRLECRRL
jgi:4-amino-4-deoxy-L-arabinose transferase-like glycosyltransferase